jgi:hypothetical protein
MGIEMFNIAAAANLAELGRRIRTLAQNCTGVRKLLPGSVAWSEAITEASSAASENVTFKVLCLSCDGLACDVATITQGLPHLIQAVPVQ